MNKDKKKLVLTIEIDYISLMSDGTCEIYFKTVRITEEFYGKHLEQKAYAEIYIRE